METSLMVSSRTRHMDSVNGRMRQPQEPCLETPDSALFAMTDFRRHPALTVTAELAIDDALGKMKRLHIHALLVVAENPEESNVQILGLITARDIAGGRPHRSTASKVGAKQKFLLVREVMTPWDELFLIDYDSLQSLTAAQAHHMFKGTSFTHLLVIERHDPMSAVAVGILSRAMLCKRLHDSARCRS